MVMLEINFDINLESKRCKSTVLLVKFIGLSRYLVSTRHKNAIKFVTFIEILK
jgi:hypothetical protein